MTLRLRCRAILEREPYEPLADPATLVRRQRLRVDEGDAVAPDDVVDEAGELAVLTCLVTVGGFAIADVERHAPMVTVVWHGDGCLSGLSKLAPCLTSVRV